MVCQQIYPRIHRLSNKFSIGIWYIFWVVIEEFHSSDQHKRIHSQIQIGLQSHKSVFSIASSQMLFASRKFHGWLQWILIFQSVQVNLFCFGIHCVCLCVCFKAFRMYPISMDWWLHAAWNLLSIRLSFVEQVIGEQSQVMMRFEKV